MGWLRLVGSLKLYVSIAECCLFYRALLQKRPMILRSLLIVATPYTHNITHTHTPRYTYLQHTPVHPRVLRRAHTSPEMWVHTHIPCDTHTHIFPVTHTHTHTHSLRHTHMHCLHADCSTHTCNTLQHAATLTSVTHSGAFESDERGVAPTHSLQHTHCNAHTATHTLQHTHGNTYICYTLECKHRARTSLQHTHCNTHTTTLATLQRARLNSYDCNCGEASGNVTWHTYGVSHVTEVNMCAMSRRFVSTNQTRLTK